MAGLLVVEVPLTEKNDELIEGENDVALDELIERLNGGDFNAVEQVLLEFEPQLRLAVRSQLQGALRVKFDSMDVVQTVWADVLAGFRDSGWKFRDRRQLKAFLLTLARHRLIDSRRHFRKAIEKERPIGGLMSGEVPAASVDRPSQELMEKELWERLLEECSPAHRAILRMKRDQVPLAEIAKRTGLHEGSVRRILYDLARRVTRPRDGD